MLVNRVAMIAGGEASSAAAPLKLPLATQTCVQNILAETWQ